MHAAHTHKHKSGEVCSSLRAKMKSLTRTTRLGAFKIYGCIKLDEHMVILVVVAFVCNYFKCIVELLSNDDSKLCCRKKINGRAKSSMYSIGNKYMKYESK